MAALALSNHGQKRWGVLGSNAGRIRSFLLNGKETGRHLRGAIVRNQSKAKRSGRGAGRKQDRGPERCWRPGKVLGVCFRSTRFSRVLNAPKGSGRLPRRERFENRHVQVWVGMRNVFELLRRIWSPKPAREYTRSVMPSRS